MPDKPEQDNYQTDHLADVAPQNAEQGVPDRQDTGGGPRGGNTVDGRTGPGNTGAQGAPQSTLRDVKDYSGDGNLATNGGDDELGTLGGWSRDLHDDSSGKQERNDE